MKFAKKIMRPTIFFGFCILTISCSVLLSKDTHWSYKGQQGPEYWGQLSPENIACTEGKNQSPVDLHRFINADLTDIFFNYKVVEQEVENHGHAVQVNFASGNTIKVDDIDFELKQVHFHTPSEHKIQGKSFPMEAHFVHVNKSGQLAVLGVMFDIGQQNEFLERVLKAAPSKKHAKVKLDKNFSPMALLAKEKGYFRYNGSLTTPPCTEGVRWLILKQSNYMSSTQVKQLRKLIGNQDNNRPLMDINARPILK